MKRYYMLVDFRFDVFDTQQYLPILSNDLFPCPIAVLNEESDMIVDFGFGLFDTKYCT